MVDCPVEAVSLFVAPFKRTNAYSTLLIIVAILGSATAATASEPKSFIQKDHLSITILRPVIILSILSTSSFITEKPPAFPIE